MGPVDVAVIVVISVAVLAVAGILVYRKVKHKGGCMGCDCGCGSGANCPHCKEMQNKK